MILLIGGKGSIGRRYQAILRYLEEPFYIHDFPFDTDVEWPEFDKAIIAAPTHTHAKYCRILHGMNKPFLCEKPLTMDPVLASELASEIPSHGFVVNNYAFLQTHRDFKTPRVISYDFFHTGNDGLIWDVCQLVYLAHKVQADLEVRRNSYTWDLHLDDWLVPYNVLETTYLQMIRAFLLNRFDTLWTLQQGAQMTQLCHELSERGGDCETFYWSPSQDKFYALSKKDLSDFRR